MTIPTDLLAFAAALRHLAAPAPDQIEYLTSLGVADLADELALEFDDSYRTIVGPLQRVSPDSAAASRELDRMLSSRLLGWTFADLKSGAWERIRARAADAIEALARDSADRASRIGRQGKPMHERSESDPCSPPRRG